MNTPNHVSLSPAQRTELLNLIHKGSTQARVLKRAHILLLADEGRRDGEIVAALHTSHPTVQRVRANFVQHDLSTALFDQPRSGRPRLVTGEVEAHLIALACSQPPAGFAQWSLHLLADRMVALNYIEHLSPTAVGYTLKKTNCSRSG